MCSGRVSGVPLCVNGCPEIEARSCVWRIRLASEERRLEIKKYGTRKDEPENKR